MNGFALRAFGLSKKYSLGEARPRYRTLRDWIATSARRLGRRGGAERHKQSEMWALRNVSFDVAPGEALGVVGRNGSGKSTLLRILSRITEPTEGRAEVFGRVGSLLEVGAGFHPELTGRENVFLSGAVMGMTRHEITSRFDDIVAFSEIEDFIDTPVKHYSSGMFVRLAFSVAAFMDHEILLVDEILAVGDRGFQEKCSGKMGEVVHRGRTVLLVSHNMSAIRRHAERALLLERGHLAYDGDVSTAIQRYAAIFSPSQGEGCLRLLKAADNSGIDYRVVSVEVLGPDRLPAVEARTGEPIVFRIRFFSPDVVKNGGVELGIMTLEGVRLIAYSTRPVTTFDLPFAPGENVVDLKLEWLPLAAGEYLLTVGLTRPMVEWLLREQEFARFIVSENDVFGSGMPIVAARALVVVPHTWTRPAVPV